MRKAEKYSEFIFFFQAEDGIRDKLVTGVQTCALPIFGNPAHIGVRHEQAPDERLYELDSQAEPARLVPCRRCSGRAVAGGPRGANRQEPLRDRKSVG